MKKFLILLLLFFTTDSFASGIASNSASAPCTNNTLETYSGNSNLAADWQPNTINLRWYNENEKLTVQQSAQSCVYDGTLTIPSTPPTRTGYTFAGWKVRLPGTYTELEYIESTGSQWIDTEIIASNRAEFSMDATMHDSEMVVFIISNIDSSDYMQGFGEYYSGVSGFNSLPTTGKHHYNLSYSDSGISFMYDNDTELHTTDFYHINQNKKIVLFGGQYAARCITAKLYYMKLYNNGDVVRDFIPAKRNSDNVVGLYDVVSQTFFMNQGTGTFIAGPVVQ